MYLQIKLEAKQIVRERGLERVRLEDIVAERRTGESGRLRYALFGVQRSAYVVAPGCVHAAGKLWQKW